MLAQFPGNDILPQFLLNASFIVLCDFNNAVDIAVNIRSIDML
jgi:hypothetical protein